MKKWVSGIIFVLLLGFTLYGTSEPWNKDLSAKINSFILKPYKYGIYLSPIQGEFYNFSPYDFFLKYEDNTIEKIIDTKSTVMAEEFTIQATILKEKVDIIKSYFQLSFPTVTFMDETTNISMRTSVVGNKLYIWAENIPQRLRKNSLVLTMSFNEYDCVFDSAGNLHYATEENLPLFLEKIPYKMSTNNSDVSAVNRGTNLLIMSTKHNSVIKIKDDIYSYKSLKINKEDLTVEIELTEPGKKLGVEVFDSLEEALL